LDALAPYPRFRIPYLRSLAALAAWEGLSVQAIGHLREAEIILLCVRWYLRSSLSYRDLEEMMRERGLQVDHTTMYRLPCSTTPQSWKNVADLTSKPATTPGEWMRRTLR
jgi:hypothetical protein